MNDRKTVRLTKEGVEIGGEYKVLLCGSLFYFRLPRAMWRDRIQKLKAVGYNCVDVYFPWNYHEMPDGSFDFTGERDISYFLRELRDAGLYVVARPGPYICSEWDGGGLPARILESGMPIRCADPEYLAEVGRWYNAVLGQISPFAYGQGGTVILLQLENELDFFDCPSPAAYISALYGMAEPYLAGVPRFCCAGQYGTMRAGAYCREGVEGTLNCYPESLDPTFDSELQGYAFRFGELQKPLLVSETNRDHFLLRRELSCGAKLLGAYNQVAGNNFDHFQAINNWGTPDSFIATVYDFESMIDAAGSYRGEAAEALLFSAFLKVAGQALAGATPAHGTVFPDRCAFRTAEGGLKVLSLCGGGSAVCVPAFSEGGEIEFTYEGRHVSGYVPAQHAPFFLFGMKLACGIPAVLTEANCEPIFADPKTLVFYAEHAPRIGLDFGDGEIFLQSDTTTHGVTVRFLGREAAVRFLFGGDLPIPAYEAKPFGGFCTATLPAFREVSAKNGTHFASLGIREGMAEYEVHAAGQLFIEHPCDMIRIARDGDHGETRFADGRDLLLPAYEGDFVVAIEKWGHCNFDDPQSPALRTASKKGALSFGSAEVETVGRCDFRLLDTFGEEVLPPAEGLPVRIGINKWNSTRKPVICAYTTPVTRRCARLIVKTTEAVDVALYLDDKLLGYADFGTFELTDYLGRGETRMLTAVYRKRVWTQDCGSLRFLHIDPAQVKRIRVRTAEELATMRAETWQAALPLSVEREVALSLDLDFAEEGYLKFTGKNIKVTCVVQGRVVGRLLPDWRNAPSLQGGDADLLYICPAWKGKAYFLVEALGEGAKLERVERLAPRVK